MEFQHKDDNLCSCVYNKAYENIDIGTLVLVLFGIGSKQNSPVQSIPNSNILNVNHKCGKSGGSSFLEMPIYMGRFVAGCSFSFLIKLCC